jgi:hypothetical protein
VAKSYSRYAYLVPREETRFGPSECEPTTEQIIEHANRILEGTQMSVRAKFTLQEIHEFSYPGKKFVFTPQYDTSIPEDQRFSKATPSGRFEMQVDNPAAIEQFKLGQAYYVDFTPVPKSQ